MAERLDRTRDDRRSMLADVTHELRTPLTVVQGGLEAMVDGVHPADEAHLAPLLAETAVMSRLLDDLRTLSLADAGRAHPPPRARRPRRDRPRGGRGAGAGRGGARRRRSRTAGDDRLVADVDPVRVREILVNLVANALRHTPAGGRGRGRSRRAADDEPSLAVRDTGEGIAAGGPGPDLGPLRAARDTGGSGLGLAIVRDLAVAHGGSVAAESDGVPGAGATFRVRLPLRD